MSTVILTTTYVLRAAWINTQVGWFVLTVSSYMVPSLPVNWESYHNYYKP